MTARKHRNQWQNPDGSLRFTVEERFWHSVETNGETYYDNRSGE